MNLYKQHTQILRLCHMWCSPSLCSWILQQESVSLWELLSSVRRAASSRQCLHVFSPFFLILCKTLLLWSWRNAGFFTFCTLMLRPNKLGENRGSACSFHFWAGAKQGWCVQGHEGSWWLSWIWEISFPAPRAEAAAVLSEPSADTTVMSCVADIAGTNITHPVFLEAFGCLCSTLGLWKLSWGEKRGASRHVFSPRESFVSERWCRTSDGLLVAWGFSFCVWLFSLLNIEESSAFKKQQLYLLRVLTHTTIALPCQSIEWRRGSTMG